MGENYKLGDRTFTASFNQAEKSEIKQRIDEFILKTGKNITTAKELFIELLTIAENSFENVKTENENPFENNINSDEIKEMQLMVNLTTEINNFKMSYPEYNEIDFENVLKIALEKAINPDIVEIEKEVIKEIQLGVKETDILLCLDTDKIQILDQILENRIRRKNYLENTTRNQLVHDLCFNKGTLFNYGGAFYTGLG